VVKGLDGCKFKETAISFLFLREQPNSSPRPDLLNLCISCDFTLPDYIDRAHLSLTVWTLTCSVVEGPTVVERHLSCVVPKLAEVKEVIGA